MKFGSMGETRKPVCGPRGGKGGEQIRLSGGGQRPHEIFVKFYSLPKNGEPFAVATLVRAKRFRVSTIRDAALGRRYAVLHGVSIPHPVVVRVQPH